MRYFTSVIQTFHFLKALQELIMKISTSHQRLHCFQSQTKLNSLIQTFQLLQLILKTLKILFKVSLLHPLYFQSLKTNQLNLNFGRGTHCQNHFTQQALRNKTIKTPSFDVEKTELRLENISFVCKYANHLSCTHTYHLMSK